MCCAMIYASELLLVTTSRQASKTGAKHFIGISFNQKKHSKTEPVDTTDVGRWINVPKV